MQGSREQADTWTAFRATLSDFAGWAQQEVPAADGVGITAVIAQHSVFAGSNGFTEALDKLQYDLDEGPCLTSVDIGSVVRSTAIGSGEPRWPRFTPRAAQLALRSSASVPLRSDGRTAHVIGSLNLYGRTADSLNVLDTAALERVAAALRGRLSSARSVAVAATNSARLHAAARKRSSGQAGDGEHELLELKA